MKKYYNKLIRDKIPQIIKDSGKSAKIVEIMSDSDFRMYLDKKLKEEVKEYFSTDKYKPNDILEELYDVVEVCMTIAKGYGISEREFMKGKSKKKLENGGFDDRMILKSISEL